MEEIKDASSDEQISNVEDKSIYENGDVGSSSVKQKSLFTISGVNMCFLGSKTNF